MYSNYGILHVDNMNSLALFQIAKLVARAGEGWAKSEQFVSSTGVGIETDDRKDVVVELERIRSLRHL